MQPQISFQNNNMFHLANPRARSAALSPLSETILFQFDTIKVTSHQYGHTRRRQLDQVQRITAELLAQEASRFYKYRETLADTVTAH